MLERLTKSGFEAGIINTRDYPNLRAGFSAVVLGPTSREGLATAQKQKVSRLAPDAYRAGRALVRVDEPRLRLAVFGCELLDNLARQPRRGGFFSQPSVSR